MKEKISKGLIIAHSPMNQTSGNGKTIAAMFQRWNSSDLAQIYITSQQPDFSICENFYQITDGEIIRATLKCKQKVGHRVDRGKRGSRDETIKKRKIVFPKSKVASQLGRNILWNKKKWKNEELVKWVDEQAPDFVFLAAGNLEAIFDMAEFITERRQIPLVLHIGDDYYTESDDKTILSEWQRKRLVGKLAKAIASAQLVIAISDKMADKFKQKYGGNYITCMNCVDLSEVYHSASFFKMEKSKYIMVYIGNLSVNRWKVLPIISKALESIIDRNIELEIYSRIDDEKILRVIQGLPHIRYCGTVYGKELHKVREDADIMLILESFDRNVKRILETAMSTKVPEYLHAGRPILAVGPYYSGTIEFLEKNKLAEVVVEESSDRIAEALCSMLNNRDIMSRRVQEGKEIVKNKFSLEENSKIVFECLNSICLRGG